MRNIKLVMVMTVLLLLMSCSETNASTNKTAKSGKATVAKTKKAAKKSQACELLQPAIVAAVFGIQQSEIENRKEQRRYCEKIWVSEVAIKDPNLVITTGKKTRDFRNRVSLQVANFQDAAAAEAAFKELTINLDPTAAGDENKYVEYSEYVEGVGLRAAWSKDVRQLSFQDGEKLLHVTVIVSDDDSVRLEYAKKLALRLLES